MVIVCALAFVSFSLCASSVYLLNDLLDLRHDRQHRSKRYRPLAAGRVDLLHAIAMGEATLAGAVAVGLLLPLPFLGMLAVYMVLTLAYSLALKRQPILDVITLAALYGIRIVAGVRRSGSRCRPGCWRSRVFLPLPCLGEAQHGADRPARARGRRPAGARLPARRPVGAADDGRGVGYVAVLVFILYINSPAVAGLYGAVERLWVIPASCCTGSAGC